MKYAVVYANKNYGTTPTPEWMIIVVRENQCSFISGWVLQSSSDNYIISSSLRGLEGLVDEAKLENNFFYNFGRGTYRWAMYDTYEEMQINHLELFL